MAIGTVIAAIIAAAAGVATTAISASQTKAAQEEARGLGIQARKDVLRQQRSQEAGSRRNYLLSKQQLEQQQEEFFANLGLAKKKEAREAASEKYNRAIGLLNEQQGLLNNVAAIWRRK